MHVVMYACPACASPAVIVVGFVIKTWNNERVVLKEAFIHCTGCTMTSEISNVDHALLDLAPYTLEDLAEEADTELRATVTQPQLLHGRVES